MVLPCAPAFDVRPDGLPMFANAIINVEINFII